MKTLKDIINRKKPLIIDGEQIKNTFVRMLPVSKFNLVKSMQSNDEDNKIESMTELILFSIVDEEGNQVIKKDDLTFDDLMTLANAIIEANGLNEGKSIEESNESPSI